VHSGVIGYRRVIKFDCRGGAGMMTRSLAAILVVLSSGSVLAESLDAEQARQFVAGKLFEFTCFDGTRGAGRISKDGSVGGTIQLHGAGPLYSASLPVGTVKVEGQKVCASLSGLPFEPCFDVDRTGEQSFHGSLSGMSWAFCDFARTWSVTSNRLRQQSEPLSLNPKRY
jgi:hypothetical protein